MNLAIDVTPEQQEKLRSLLSSHLPNTEVWAYGSRIRWTSRPESDLDMAVFTTPAQAGDVARLREAFEESDLPFRVDLFVWDEVPEGFRKQIQQERVVLRDNNDGCTGGGLDDWRDMPFSEAVVINPAVRLERGTKYPFVDMATVNPGSRSVDAVEQRDYSGGGSRFQSGDTLMARITPCLENGKIARYRAAQLPVTAHGSTEFIVIRGRADVTDSEFAYYLTHWEGVRSYAIDQMTGTSGRQRVPTDSLNHLTVPVPPLPEQYAIAHILRTLDDKIDLNRRMNETLEAMARAVFKDWFVDFRPVRAKAEGRDTGLPPRIADLFPDRFIDSELGELPDGWLSGTIRDVAVLNPESWSPKRPPKEVTYVDLANTKWGYIDGTCRLRWGDAPSRARRVLRRGDTIIATVRPGNGSFALIDEDGLTGSTGFAVLHPVLPMDRELVWAASTSPENINRLAHLADGGAYPAVRYDVVGATPVVLANLKTRKMFSRIVGRLLDKQETNKRASRMMVAIRDALLPKLISGEIRTKASRETMTETADKVRRADGRVL